MEGIQMALEGFQITTMIAEAFTAAGSAITFMNSNPICWFPVGIGAAGAAIGLVKRATRIRR